MIYNDSMHKRKSVGFYRIVFGVGTLVAVLVQVGELRQAGVFNLLNFLGYFTNLSNIFAAIIFVASGFALFRSKNPSSTYDQLRGAATLYMTITGLVYVTLLSNEDLGRLLPWVNVWLHFVMPVVVLADWIYRPPKSGLNFGTAKGWLVFPSLFVLYTMIRGEIVDWYPYPFLNPDKAGGYTVVAGFSVAIAAVFVAVSWLLVKAARRSWV